MSLLRDTPLYLVAQLVALFVEFLPSVSLPACKVALFLMNYGRVQARRRGFEARLIVARGVAELALIAPL
jgi:hypothetical protein